MRAMPQTFPELTLSDTGHSTLHSFLWRSGYKFVTPSPATHRRVNARPGNELATDLRGAFGWSRPFARDCLPPDLFETLDAGGIIRPCETGWTSSVRASTLDGELFLHSAYPTLSDNSVFFGPDTYRFVRAVKLQLREQQRPVRRILDIGCGSGAGGILAAKYAASEAVVLSDINASALRLAEVNAAAAGISASFIQSDLFANLKGDFDMIISNPPYMNDPLQRAYRHGGGDFGGALSIKIIHEAKNRLAPGGELLLYTGSAIVAGEDRIRRAAEEIFAKSGWVWSYEEIDPDVFGEELETAACSVVDRIAAVVLVARKPGGASCW